MAITDQEAEALVAQLLSVDNPKTTNHPLWLKVVDLAFWAKAQFSKPNRLNPKPKQSRTEYHRLYQRRRRAKLKTP